MPTIPPTHLLVVGDDDAILLVLRDLLHAVGYQVTTAPDGLLGLEQMRTSPHRLVVLPDYRLPGLNGQAILQAVAADPPLAQQHTFILLTANAGALPPTFEHLLTHPAVPVVRKPFDLEDLLQVVAVAASRLQDVAR